MSELDEPSEHDQLLELIILERRFVAAIDGLHKPDKWATGWCAECAKRRWPCPTYQIIHQSEGADIT